MDEKLGATGKFPEGKLNDDDEGELQASIRTEGKNVIIDFGKPVAWLALPKEDAIASGMSLIKHAIGGSNGKDIRKLLKGITEFLNGYIKEGCTPIDTIVLRKANHDLIQENHELLDALKQAVMLVEGSYPSDNKLIWASVTIFRTLIAEIEGE
jgi:hypothetical protein